MGFQDNVNVDVRSAAHIAPCTYKTVVLKQNVTKQNLNVLTQAMLDEWGKNTKFVIKWDYVLNGGTIEMPKGCLIDFDGGSISDGTLLGDNTILIYKQPIEEVIDVTLNGTFIYDDGQVDKNDNTNGMAKIYLKKNKSFESQVTQANTIYVIQYDFTLGEDITIPENCILEFDGGSIASESEEFQITTNNCFIKGNALFGANLTFSGTIKNGFFNVLWLSNADIGDKINRAALYFDNIYLPAGDYSFNVPINIGNRGSAKYYKFDGILTYNGIVTNNSSAFKISCCTSKIEINWLKMKDFRTSLDWRSNRTTNFIGLELYNCLNNVVNITFIQGFNECLRLHSDGTSCVGNYIIIGSIYDYNYAIRLYQENDGWTNENTFVGQGEIRNHGVPDAELGEKYAFYLAGPNWDNISFKDPNAVDNYNQVDSIIIRGFCLENHTYPIFVANTTGLIIDGIREENVTGLLMVKGTQFGLASYTPKYSDSLYQSNIDDASTIRQLPLATYIHLTTFEYTRTSSYFTCSDNWVCYDTDTCEVILTGSINEYHGAYGVLMDRETFFHFAENANAHIYIVYLNANKENITPTVVSNHPGHVSGINRSYYDNLKCIRIDSGAYNQFWGAPSEVSYVFIGAEANQIPLNSKYKLYIESGLISEFYEAE